MKNLEKIEQLVGLIDKLFTFANVVPENLLLAKMNAKKTYEDALLVAHSLQDDLKDETAEEIQAENTAGPSAFQVGQEALAAAQTQETVIEALANIQKSAKVREGVDAFTAAKTALAQAIPHEDQNILSLNSPANTDELFVNSFTKKKEKLVLVLGTAHDAYAVTVSDQGTHALSPVKYWSPATE